LGPIISRLFTCSNAEKKLKKTKGACSSPISMAVPYMLILVLHKEVLFIRASTEKVSKIRYGKK
jgi:hypothetical protein